MPALRLNGLPNSPPLPQQRRINMSRRTALLRFQIVALAVFALCSCASGRPRRRKRGQVQFVRSTPGVFPQIGPVPFSPTPPERQWTVYLLPHSHNDIGYTHLQPEVERKQWQNIDAALEL